ncbi:MAG TPA: hypothetical protein ENK18_06195 [Deltaproteobacteria bacterium]|nr:hypothetical protein [Deltaproteobacteria bacterium]
MFALSIALLQGCAPGGARTYAPHDGGIAPSGASTPPAPGPQPGAEPCGNKIASAFPLDGADDVYYRTDVQLQLDVADASAQLVVTDDSGREILGSSTVQGALVRWTGEPLEPETLYQVTLHWSCPPVELSWSTTETGGLVEVPIVDRVYELDLRQGRWLKPRGIEGLLGSWLRPLLVSATESDGILTLAAALTELDGSQDRCAETLELPPAAFLDPYFELDQGALALSLDGLVVELSGLTLSGAFSPGAERIEGLQLQGLVDTRSMAELLLPGGPETLVCDLFAGLGAPCVACPGGAGSYCLEAQLDDLRLPGRPSTHLEPRSAEQIAADPSCG